MWNALEFMDINVNALIIFEFPMSVGVKKKKIYCRREGLYTIQ